MHVQLNIVLSHQLQLSIAFVGEHKKMLTKCVKKRIEWQSLIISILKSNRKCDNHYFFSVIDYRNNPYFFHYRLTTLL
jgi:hypothetical protein